MMNKSTPPNLLFLMGVYPAYGGVEKVSTVLANAFVQRGHGVSIVSFEQPHPELIERELDPRVRVYALSYPVSSANNLRRLSALIREQQTDVLINQWCMPYYVARLCHRAVRGTNCKVIAVHHNLPNTNNHLQALDIALERGARPRWWNRLKWHGIRLVSRLSLRYTYSVSDRYLVLCPAFIPIAAQFMHLASPKRLQSMFNPITLDGSHEVLPPKRHELLYVGRIEYNQKRTYRLVDVWAQLSPLYPDWQLTIVGDGPDLSDLKSRFAAAHLSRVSFEGFRDPQPYYRRASLLMLVSEYEGFGLVLAEAMSHRVVPVVYGSFASVYDLITSGENGVITPQPYATEDMVAALKSLMDQEALRTSMGLAAQKSVAKFELTSIVEGWEDLFRSL
jgi:glycosyltransferase involved in cell wall biosynthesis